MQALTLLLNYVAISGCFQISVLYKKKIKSVKKSVAKAKGLKVASTWKPLVGAVGRKTQQQGKRWKTFFLVNKKA